MHKIQSNSNRFKRCQVKLSSIERFNGSSMQLPGCIQNNFDTEDSKGFEETENRYDSSPKVIKNSQRNLLSRREITGSPEDNQVGKIFKSTPLSKVQSHSITKPYHKNSKSAINLSPKQYSQSSRVLPNLNQLRRSRSRNFNKNGKVKEDYTSPTLQTNQSIFLDGLETNLRDLISSQKCEYNELLSNKTGLPNIIQKSTRRREVLLPKQLPISHTSDDHVDFIEHIKEAALEIIQPIKNIKNFRSGQKMQALGNEYTRESRRNERFDKDVLGRANYLTKRFEKDLNLTTKGNICSH